MTACLHARIYQLVQQIPKGQVATYGQIAKMVGHCGPRQVGYALSHSPDGMNIPWQRVINSQGRISERKEGGRDPLQMKKLKDEGIVFSKNGKIDLREFGWLGPDWDWLVKHGFHHALPSKMES